MAVFVDEEVEAAEEEVIFNDDGNNEELEVEEEAVVETGVEDGAGGSDTPVAVIPSKAFAKTTVPSGPAVAPTTVCLPVESKEVISSSSLGPRYVVQTAPAPGRMGSSTFGASKLYPLFHVSGERT